MPRSYLQPKSTKQYNIRHVPLAKKYSQGSHAPSINNPPVDVGPSIFSSMIQGFGFGAGSSIAHRAVAAIGNNLNGISTTTNANPNPDCIEKLNILLQHCNDNESVYCEKLHEEYLKCLNNKK